MYKAKDISPIIPSFNMKETIAFFRDFLGFTVSMDEQEYAIVCKDAVTIQILPAAADIGEMEFYLIVDNIEQVWNSIKDKLGDIKARKPFDREYGMREIHIVTPKTQTLILIGQNIE